MSTRQQPDYRRQQGQPVLSRHQLAAEQERVRRWQLQQAHQTRQGQRQHPKQGDGRITADRETDDEILNEEEDDEVWPDRLPSSARRYDVPTDQTTWEYMQGNRRFISHQGSPPARQTSPQFPSRRQRPRQEAYREKPRSQSGGHWLLIFGIGMLAMLALWVLGMMLMNWWNVMQDDWHYGRPRTYQIDAVVGHSDSPNNPSHFIALNLNRHVVIIEIPGGDASKTKIYTGPTLFGNGQNLTPVTLSFKDVNGDGKLDMLVHVQDQIFVMMNENGEFRPARPSEHINPIYIDACTHPIDLVCLK
jgi:hypothetical protein